MEGRAAHARCRAASEATSEQIHALIPAPRKGARILLLSDADGRDDYDVFFVIRLFYGDPALDVRPHESMERPQRAGGPGRLRLRAGLDR